MKSLMILCSAMLAFAATAFADEAFDKVVKVASTPINQITTVEQANTVFDAAIATTNRETLTKLVSSKMIDSAKAHKAFLASKLWRIAAMNAIVSKDITMSKEVITSIVDDTLANPNDDKNARDKTDSVYSIIRTIYESDEEIAKLSTSVEQINHMFANVEAEFCVSQAARLLAVDKPKIYLLGVLLSSYSNDTKIMNTAKNAFIIENANKITAVMQSVEFSEAAYVEYDEMLLWFWNIKPELLNSVYNANRFKFTVQDKHPLKLMLTAYLPSDSARSTFVKNADATVIASAKAPESFLVGIAKTLDKYNGTKEASASIYDKLTDVNYKIAVMEYLNDNDKAIDLCIKIPNDYTAEQIEKLISRLNSVDADHREDDMKKALKNINKKYTIKLYDDRDTWEPILSKVRAMLDTY